MIVHKLKMCKFVGNSPSSSGHSVDFKLLGRLVGGEVMLRRRGVHLFHIGLSFISII